MIETHGPIFNGEADSEIARMCREMEKAIGDDGKRIVSTILPTVLRNPTGRYQSSIRTEVHGAGVDVTDGGIIYGPWLEGVGSRNRTTRFKGYATFRRAVEVLRGRAGRIAAPIVSRYVRRLG